jgi:hypothetical protein
MQSNKSLQSIPRGSTVTLYCAFIAKPVPDKVEWYRNETLLSSGVSTSGMTTVLTLEDFQESGVIQCRVANQHGSGLASVFLCLEPEQGRGWG